MSTLQFTIVEAVLLLGLAAYLAILFLEVNVSRRTSGFNTGDDLVALHNPPKLHRLPDLHPVALRRIDIPCVCCRTLMPIEVTPGSEEPAGGLCIACNQRGQIWAAIQAKEQQEAMLRIQEEQAQQQQQMDDVAGKVTAPMIRDVERRYQEAARDAGRPQ